MRGGRQMKSKPREKALLRSNIVKVEQTNSARRLQKDLKELEDSKIPLVGVAARPLSNSLYLWHGNLKAPAHSIFAGGVFHIEITFPQNYPMSPPSIVLCTPITHPNVPGGRSICLDILQEREKELYQGWTSAYTIEAILIQLQSFLFPQFTLDSLWTVSTYQAQNEVRAANDYKCPHPDCNHQGPIKPYPPFNDAEKDLKAFRMVKTAEQLLGEELVCFNTKNKLKEGTLGIGVSIGRLPRTGEIRMITPTLDLLCLRAFIKHKVRHSLSNEKFTHWLPLYFGEQEVYETKQQAYDAANKKAITKSVTVDCKERFSHLLKKSLSFICTGSTKKEFKGSMIMEVMPKIIITHIADMIQEKKHVSILAIRRLVNFVRLFRLLMDQYPEIGKDIDSKIEQFINEPEKRHKDYTSSLGDLLSFVTVSQKFKIEDIMPAYLEEQTDRQMFWILREIPELDHTNPDYQDKDVIIEEARSEVCFKTGLTGFHITLFFYFFNKMVIEGGGKDLEKFVQLLDAHFGCLEFKQENTFQKKCHEIQKVKSYYQYFPLLGVPMPDEHSLKDRLKVAIENSRKKKYHGNDNINEIPEIETQATQYLEEGVSPFKFYNEETKLFLDATDPQWKQAVAQKFSWISQVLTNTASGDELSAKDFAYISDNDNIERATTDFTKLKNKGDKLRIQVNKDLNGNFIQTIQSSTMTQDYSDNFSWRELFIKLCFEQMLQYFPQHQDFKLFYKYIDIMGPHIETLRLQILDKTKFKSNNYYLMVLVGRMKNLKCLKFHKDSMINLGVDGFKYLQKGFKYFQEAGGSLQKIQINNILGSQSDEYLYQCFKCLPDLQVLKINDSCISLKDSQTIGRILSDFKGIQEIDLCNTSLDNQKGKEIADGLMRAKQLQIIKLNNNYSISVGANSILYNLAFSPKIKHIDLSDCYLNNADTAEALYKLVKISGSLETLILRNTQINNQLKQEFFVALGENKTIHYINLDSNSQHMTPNNLNLLAQACGMNNKKNGNLKYLSLEKAVQNYSYFNTFLQNFRISDYDHEMWYGDKKIAKDMQKEQLEKKWEFGLQYLNLGQSIINGNAFKFKEISKKKEPTWPLFMQLFATKGFDTIKIDQACLQKQDMELLEHSLANNPFGETTIRVLNLSRNQITKEGAKILANALAENKSLEVLDLSQCKLGVSGTVAIAEALQKNNTLKHLNLFRNKVDVDGARSLKKLLAVNKSLEFLDLGYNRLREKGLKAITDGIISNPDSKIKQLGLRFNFINDDGFSYFFENAIIKNQSKISHIYLLQNYLSEHFTIALAGKVEATGKKLYVDVFEKLQYLQQDRLDNAIWISPVLPHHVNNPEAYVRFFMNEQKCGLIKDIRIRRGQKIAGKPKDNIYAIIEYVDSNSVPRSLRVASKKKSIVQNNRFRIYKAGTRTIVFVRPQKRRQ